MTNQSTTAQVRETGNPIKAVIVGAGHRSMLYASYAHSHPEELQIVGVVDPDKVRRDEAARTFDLPENRCYVSIEAMTAAGQIADAAINGTMDRLHVPTSIELLQAGYHVLLEKPIGTSEEEVLQLQQAAEDYGKHVMICHVLRFAPFYSEIRQRVAAGEIGDLQTVQLVENVSYHHLTTTFVRGKWNRKDTGGSSLLLAKCCHDLDLMTWMKSGVRPEQVASFGGLNYFREEQAPAGAGTRCLVDCPIEEDCVYSARKMYLDHNLWTPYVWHSIEHLGPHPTLAQKEESLATDNPHGRCVWKCDNDVVDHQSLIVTFEDGSTASHTLNGNTAKPCRSIHLTGTKGEIQGVMEDGYYVVRYPDLDAEGGWREERYDLNVSQDMHGGGDLRLVGDFVNVLRGREPSLSTTTLADSINGHRIGFAADRSMEEQQPVTLSTV